MNSPNPPIKIPYTELSQEALQGVIEQFISRDGPDSGYVDITFQKKVEQVMQKNLDQDRLLFYTMDKPSLVIFFRKMIRW